MVRTRAGLAVRRVEKYLEERMKEIADLATLTSWEDECVALKRVYEELHEVMLVLRNGGNNEQG